MRSSIRDYIKSVGLCLAFVGMQFNTALKNIFPGTDLIVIVMMLSAFLLMDFRYISKPKISVKLFGVLCFQICLLVMNIVSENGTTQLLIFHIYLIVFIIALNSNRDYDIRFESFGRVLFYLTGIISLVVVFQATNGFTQLITSYHGTGKLWLSAGGDPITMSRALEMNIISVLLYKKRNLLEKVCAIMFFISDVIGLFSFGNRSTIACSLVIFLLWYIVYNSRKLSGISIIRTMAILVVILFAIRYIPYFGEKITGVYDSIWNGIRTLLGIQIGNLDASAQTRVLILDEMKQTYFGNDFLKNILLGLGYNNTYVDRPLIQAFFDLGFFGGAIYAFFLLIVPIKWMICEFRFKYNFNGAWTYVIFISIQCIVDQLITGLPYYYSLWIPTIFMLFSVSFNRVEKVAVETQISKLA